MRKHSQSKKNSPNESVDLANPDLYLNRELSLLAFQRRVLEEARNQGNPLLERIKFLSILGSNLDEFFMVRTAGLVALREAGVTEVGPDAMTPVLQLANIRREVKRLYSDASKCLHKQLLPELADAGLQVLSYSAVTKRQSAALKDYFRSTVFPVLTPLAFDPGRPFPHISNLSLNLAVSIRDPRGVQHFARVKVPDLLPQLVPVSDRLSSKERHRPHKLEFIWLEDLIAANLGTLFPGMEVIESHAFDVTRDAETRIRELEAEDLLETIAEGLKQRRFGSVVRLAVAAKMPRHLLTILVNNLETEKSAVYKVDEPLRLSRLMSLYRVDRPDLKYRTFVPASHRSSVEPGDDADLFAAIRRHDILLHHPFDSFQPVVEFLRNAGQDKDVLAIKIVLYRVGPDSPIVEALLGAMERGKQVAVLVELKARFDEESNIEWARRLEEEGVHVVYGLVGLKSHCKVAMVVRREGEKIRRYVHLGTGNYNAVTSHLYTDLGMLTCKEELAEDVTHLFNLLTGYSAGASYETLLVAPLNMRERFIGLIEREIANSLRGVSAEIIFKMNSLVDSNIIRTLYRASQAGVRIRLMVRGICCLRPGIAGVSDNIEVLSIVGRFLEHSRIYYFANAGQPEVYLGSADLMPRNLDRRVEILFPVRDEALKARITSEILTSYLSDNVKARSLNPDGSYRHRERAQGELAFDAQEQLLRNRGH